MHMEFRRITNLPPYVFTIINGLKIEARQRVQMSSTLGSETLTFHHLMLPLRNSPNRRKPKKSSVLTESRLTPAREEVAKYYERTWGVHLDPELEVTNTIGSKEGSLI